MEIQKKNGSDIELRIVFMGTPEFAVPSLEILIKNNHEIAAVVTQPDKPCGRGKRMASPPVKEFALENGLNVLQPERIRNESFFDELTALSPELIVVVAYGKILPSAILKLPKYGCINIHASLLPKFRGAAPINWAIIKGERVTGVTSMLMDEGMDTGDILLQREFQIPEEMDASGLHDALSTLGAELLAETLEQLLQHELVRIPQEHEQATIAPIMTKELGLIDWKLDSVDIHNLVRGVTPWPGAYTFYKGCRMKVWKAELREDLCVINGTEPGSIIEINRSGISVACGSGILKITQVQMENCKRLCSEECWHNIDREEIFGADRPSEGNCPQDSI